MAIILIDREAFEVSEAIYRKIREKSKELAPKGYYDSGESLEMSDYLDSLKPEMKSLGEIKFDFRS